MRNMAAGCHLIWCAVAHFAHFLLQILKRETFRAFHRSVALHDHWPQLTARFQRCAVGRLFSLRSCYVGPIYTVGRNIDCTWTWILAVSDIWATVTNNPSERKILLRYTKLSTLSVYYSWVLAPTFCSFVFGYETRKPSSELPSWNCPGMRRLQMLSWQLLGGWKPDMIVGNCYFWLQRHVAYRIESSQWRW